MRSTNPAAGPVFASLCEKEQEKHCNRLTKGPPVSHSCAVSDQIVSIRLHEGGMSCAHFLTLCGLTEPIF